MSPTSWTHVGTVIVAAFALPALGLRSYASPKRSMRV